MSEPGVPVLIELFNQCFRERFQTLLVAGGTEPEYRPAEAGEPYHRILFANGYFASGLHEIAHWCVAGPARRQLYDYGYWYQPDGRTRAQQQEFERVEVRPQAYEWLLSLAAGHRFHFSADNLSASPGGPSDSFRQAVWQCARDTLDKGLPARLNTFCLALSRQFDTGFPHKACQELADSPLADSVVQ